MLRGEWATQLLQKLGNSSPDAQTVNFVASWTLGENTLAKFNPLATTQSMPGSTCFNCPLANVQNFISNEQGLDATVKTLNNGRYPHILEGLKTNDPEQSANGVELGVWGTGLGFVALWRTGDHRNEPLKSHDGIGSVSGGSWDPLPDFEAPDRPTPEQAAQSVINLSSTSIARNITFIGFGGLLLFIAIILGVRSFVPTQQIVKTIASAA